MDTNANYTVVGLFVIVLGSLIVAASLWLSAGFHTKTYVDYAVYMQEPVSGLSEQASVKYNGVQVGFVRQIILNRKDPQQVILHLAIEKGTPVTTSTVATLKAQGITGLTYVGLSAKTPDAPLLKKKPGQSMPVIKAEPSLLLELYSAVRDVSTSVKEASSSLERIINKENAKTIRQSLVNIEVFSSMLATQSNNVSSTIKDAKKLMNNVATASQDLPEVMANLRQSIKAIKLMSLTVGQAGRDVSSAMKAGKYTLQNFNQQALPPAVTFIKRLDNIAINLEQISMEMKQNPSILIRGSQPPKLGPGEK